MATAFTRIKSILIAIAVAVLCSSVFPLFYLNRYFVNLGTIEYSLGTAVPAVPVQNPSIYFIHVGKAGGLTIRKNLFYNDEQVVKSLICRMLLFGPNGYMNRDPKIKDHCYKPPTKTRPTAATTTATSSSLALSKHVLGFFHIHNSLFSNSQAQWFLNNTNIFLFNVRDPIDRIVSAYNYHRKKDGSDKHYQEFYQYCFPNGLNPLVETMMYRGSNNNYNRTLMNCKLLALDVIHGKIHSGGNHFYYNYEYYAENSIQLKPQHAIAVIRTENMWEDISNLDIALGGTGKFTNNHNKPKKFSHGSETWEGALKYTSEISPSNTKYLCCLVYKEMEIYQDLVLKAFNLNPAQKQETVQKVLDHCQIDAPPSSSQTKLPFSWTAYYKDTCTKLL